MCYELIYFTSAQKKAYSQTNDKCIQARHVSEARARHASEAREAREARERGTRSTPCEGRVPLMAGHARHASEAREAREARKRGTQGALCAPEGVSFLNS